MTSPVHKPAIDKVGFKFKRLSFNLQSSLTPAGDDPVRGCSLILLFTEQVRWPWLPQLNFKWKTVKCETVQHMTGNYSWWCESVKRSLPLPLLLCVAPAVCLTVDRHFFRVWAKRCWQFVATPGQKLNMGQCWYKWMLERGGGTKSYGGWRIATTHSGRCFFFFFLQNK